MDTAQWPQEIVVKPLEEIVTNTCSKPQPSQPQQPPASGAAGGERKARPEKDQPVNCPRCNSVNTKFCYYNNYSLSQPRYFCKGCRRYWTEGGSLRNIPVGGGSRKNKRSHSTSVSSSSSDISNTHSDSTQPATKKHISDHHHHLMSMSQQSLTGQNPKFLETTQQDLSLGFPPHGLIRSNFTDLIHNIGNSNNNTNKNNNNNNSFLGSSCSVMATSSLDIIRTTSDNGNSSNSSFMGFPIHNQDPSPGGFYSMQDHYKPCNTNTTLLGFSLDHHHNNGFNGGFQGGDGEGGDDVSGRHLYPFEDLKLPVSSSSSSINIHFNAHQKRGGGGGDDAAATSGGYWTGMLSGSGSLF